MQPINDSDDDLSESQQVEFARRIESAIQRPERLIPHDQVMAKLRAIRRSST